MSKEERKKIIFNKEITIKDIIIKFKQPDWCCNLDALKGLTGCWALFLGYIHTEADCKNCGFYKKNRENLEK